MSTVDIIYLEEKRITVWMPDSATDKDKAALAVDHIALNVFAGQRAKLLSIVPVGDPAGDVPVLKK